MRYLIIYCPDIPLRLYLFHLQIYQHMSQHTSSSSTSSSSSSSQLSSSDAEVVRRWWKCCYQYLLREKGYDLGGHYSPSAKRRPLENHRDFRKIVKTGVNIVSPSDSFTSLLVLKNHDSRRRPHARRTSVGSCSQ